MMLFLFIFPDVVEFVMPVPLVILSMNAQVCAFTEFIPTNSRMDKIGI